LGSHDVWSWKCVGTYLWLGLFCDSAALIFKKNGNGRSHQCWLTI
jgi:hypothetical protein